MTGRPRVVVTGLGVRTSAGGGVAQMWDALCAPRSCARGITGFDPEGLPVRIACEIPDFSPVGYLSAKEAARTDRSTQLAVCAATDALTDAGLRERTGGPRWAVVTGSANGGEATREAALLDADARGHGRPRASHVPAYMANAGAAMLSLLYGITGPGLCFSTACASGGHAVGEGAQLIRTGAADVVLAGAHEACVTPTIVLAFAKSGSLARDNGDPARASRPFDRDRSGFVLAEGAAFLILESWSAARARGANVRAELVGYGRTSDAHHLTAPLPDGAGAAACMRQALADAQLTPRDVAHVHAHGTATELGDLAEARALAAVFGAGAVPVTSSKAVLGHAIGAAGAIAAVVATLSVRWRAAPPVANLDALDPRCEIDAVRGGVRDLPAGPVVCNSFGFGGHNTCLVLAPGPEG
ncbi:beta-ketoacyl-[acyl-carrier-protein] synthase family protein [Streptomyces sp. NPDC046215]|uniref:Beta-ketoacyl-ACP synthase II n=1 Tax=Streptomyces stramineus TaxID=173861 RepID=A0ABN0ZBY1_9ACTN